MAVSTASVFPSITYKQYLLYKLLNVTNEDKVVIPDHYLSDFNGYGQPDLSTSRLLYLFPSHDSCSYRDNHLRGGNSINVRDQYDIPSERRIR